jgi:hypothetical protein
MNARDQVRALTVGARKQFKSETVKVGDAEIEVRQPSIRGRGIIMKAAGAAAGTDKIDLAALQVEAVIQCCFIKDTELRAFEDADRDNLFNQPAGGFVDELAEVALRLLNVDTGDLEKNSVRTLSEDSSSH